MHGHKGYMQSIGQRIDGYWIMYPSYQEGIMWYLMPDSDGRTSIEIIGNIHDKEEEMNNYTTLRFQSSLKQMQ